MSQVTENQITEALRSVEWEGKDIISQGVFVGVTFAQEEKGTKANLILQIEPRKDSDIEDLHQRVEKAVKALEGISSVAVIFTSHQTPHKHEHAEGPQKLALPGIGHIIAVASGKGGVGKSTTAVNIAAALSKKNLKVGILDADVYGPSIPRMMGLAGEPFMNENGKLEPLVRHNIKVMSMGFLVDEAEPMIWRGPMVHSAITQLFRDVNWGDLDVLVVDLPPGTGDAQLTMAQSIPLSGAVIVSTPQDIALLDARKALAMFRKTNVKVLGIVENMSYFECPHCQHRSDIFSHGGAREEAEKLGTPFLGEIPLDIPLREKSDEGEPLVFSAPDSHVSAQYGAIADKLIATLKA